MIDLTFKFGAFASTSCDVFARSEAGREFLGEICGAASLNGRAVPVSALTLPKTKGADLAAFARGRNLIAECVAE